MRKLPATVVAVLLTACSSSGGDDAPQFDDPACSLDGQKQFVLDTMRRWYLWNDLLPAQVDLSQYETPEELLEFLTSFQPLDDFSFINSADADAQFFGEGRFEGFGFSSRFVAADDLRLTRVFVDSPANAAGLARGQRILRLNGRTIAEIQAAEGVSAVFETSPLEFAMRNADGSEFMLRPNFAMFQVPLYQAG